MGITFARTGRIGTIGMACVAAVLTLSGCTITIRNEAQQELEKRHFSEISNDEGTNIYWGTLGTCRIRFEFSNSGVTGSLAGTDQQLVRLEEPTAASIRADKRFDYCSNKIPGR